MTEVKFQFWKWGICTRCTCLKYIFTQMAHGHFNFGFWEIGGKFRKGSLHIPTFRTSLAVFFFIKNYVNFQNQLKITWNILLHFCLNHLLNWVPFFKNNTVRRTRGKYLTNSGNFGGRRVFEIWRKKLYFGKVLKFQIIFQKSFDFW